MLEHSVEMMSIATKINSLGMMVADDGPMHLILNLLIIHYD